MKKISIIIVVCMAACLFVACQSPVATTDGGTTTTVAHGSVKVKDANGVFIGYSVYADAGIVSVFTNENYIVDLAWDGLLSYDYVSFTLANAGGVAFIASSYKLSSSFTISGGNTVLYKLKNLNASLGVSDPSITHSESEIYPNGTISNSTQSIYTYLAYELEPTTRAAVGLPATIASPLQLSFE